MSKLLLLNTTANTGSTGRIAEQIGLLAQQSGYDARFAYGSTAYNSQLPLIKIGGKANFYAHALETRLLDNHGFSSRAATRKLVKELEQWKPDVVNIHNLHGYYLNINILFDYLKKIQCRIVWTFHDCWAFTGHCSFFEGVNCLKWQKECKACPLSKRYPKSWFIDRSRLNFKQKKEIFNGLDHMTIVVPSNWLANFLPHSFLNTYEVKVINNGIDLNMFTPRSHGKILDTYKLADKQYILGVADAWNDRKGLSDFIKLRDELPMDIPIVLVGSLEQQAIQKLPEGILAVPRTENIDELAILYSSAAVFVNPTYIDNFPTTNIEALACGTPIVTYFTGGSAEILDETTGIAVTKGDLAALKAAIQEVLKNGKEKYRIYCRKRAEEKYNKEDRFRDYINLF